MADQDDQLSPLTGRELFDANGVKIGTIAGPAYRRAKFDTVWLLLETGASHRLVVPLDQIRLSGDRLVLPYPKGYVEGGPSSEAGRRLSRAEERRLCLHYGLDYDIAGPGACARCGLCPSRRRGGTAGRVPA